MVLVETGHGKDIVFFQKLLRPASHDHVNGAAESPPH